ncbi:hypothetical protein ABH944_008537 [Caballeronia udeis]|uniref:RES domain-containing protein n=1 Tax=Caballeronia udeis TaxID=1232866 RepID=A0ABW8N181_9BURK
MSDSSEQTEHRYCPLPPDGFCKAALPAFELNLASTQLLRIHRTARHPIHYNRRSTSPDVFRFDAPDDRYGVLYAALSFDVCMAETVMRGRYQGKDVRIPHLIAESDITERSVALLGFEEARVLRLADLTQPLWHLGFDTRVLAVGDYATPNLWGAAIHDNPANFDGIYFVSRFANQPSIGIFSDRAVLVRRGESIPLAAYPELAPFLDRFNIGLADPTGDDWRAETK